VSAVSEGLSELTADIFDKRGMIEKKDMLERDLFLINVILFLVN